MRYEMNRTGGTATLGARVGCGGNRIEIKEAIEQYQPFHPLLYSTIIPGDLCAVTLSVPILKDRHPNMNHLTPSPYSRYFDDNASAHGASTWALIIPHDVVRCDTFC